MFNVFQWIRSGVRQAVHAGLADALNDVTHGRVEDGDVALARVIGALPPPPVDVTPPDGAEENGKGRKKSKAV